MMNNWKVYLKCGGVFLLMIFTLTQARAQETSTKNQKKSDKLVRRAEKAKQDHDFAESEAYYRRALGRNPKNAEANYNFGHLYTDHKKEIESMSQLLKSAENAKTKELKHKAFHNLGNAYMDEKDYRQAVNAYKDALRNDPTDDQTRYNLAIAKEKLKKNPDKKKKKNKDKKKDDKNKDKNKKDKSKNKENTDKKNKDKEKKKDKNKGDKKNKKNDKQKSGDKNQKKSEDKNQKQQNQNKEGQKESPQEMSKKQAENLLRAAKNLEKKVQKKKRGEKAKKAKKNQNKKGW